MSDIDQSELHLAEILEGLHSRWTPHEKQIDIGHDLFYKGAKNIFICAGRNFGKTEIASYATWRYAMQHPGSQNYIFEPFQKQAREILWASRRIQDFGPKEWLQGEPNNSELRVNFKNGSFIKLEGSDNVAAIAGIKPKGLIVYDEFKDHRYDSIKNFEPNRAAFDVPALFVGTPPIISNHFVDYMEMAKESSDWSFFHAPTSSNPHIKASWLEKMKAQMIKMGELEEYLRSYEALFIKGGKSTIFPWAMSHNYPTLESVMPKDLNKWIILIGMDPASTSTFGVIFFFHNPYTKQTIAFDEIYEKEMAKMTARSIWDEIQRKIEPFKRIVRTVDYVYDEAAAWFRSEIGEHDKKSWLIPSDKSKFGVDGYIIYLRQFMKHNILTITDRCPEFRKELEGYIKNDKGQIPKENDHLINAAQYALGSLGYDFNELFEPKPEQKEERRAFTINEDMSVGNEYAEMD